jgi:hypothetical protein
MCPCRQLALGSHGATVGCAVIVPVGRKALLTRSGFTHLPHAIAVSNLLVACLSDRRDIPEFLKSARCYIGTWQVSRVVSCAPPPRSL